MIDIFTLNYVWLNEISVVIESASVTSEDLCVLSDWAAW